MHFVLAIKNRILPQQQKNDWSQEMIEQRDQQKINEKKVLKNTTKWKS